jgi:hypothetical protein
VMQTPFKFADTTAAVQVRVPRRAVIASSAGVRSAEARGLATLSGTVVGDSANRPIGDAEIVLPELGLSARSDARGQFTIAGIIPGKHQLTVRRVGYGAMQTQIEFAARQVVDRRVVLNRLAILDSVLSTATPDKDPGMQKFEEHRKRGFGTYLTRADLAKNETKSLQSVVLQLSGLAYVRGRAGQLWVLGRRAPFSQCRPAIGADLTPQDTACMKREGRLYIPDGSEKVQGLLIGCYAEVWLDRTQLNRAIPTDPFDVNTIAVSQIEALEWYSGGSAVPPEYQSMQTSRCGVLILHSRRFKK